ncbi:hypothetical protein [Pantoea dispersa]|uniref:hypothetical protein n=1 Tax=Pantoea dispersa TaxID=59814 RepID=UPI00187B3360|nr:hypothetical protein [Pantoea dispersa]
MLCHGTVCVVGKIRDLILQLSKSSIYSTKPHNFNVQTIDVAGNTAKSEGWNIAIGPDVTLTKGSEDFFARAGERHKSGTTFPSGLKVTTANGADFTIDADYTHNSCLLSNISPTVYFGATTDIHFVAWGWGSTGVSSSPLLVEIYDIDGKLIDKLEIQSNNFNEKVPLNYTAPEGVYISHAKITTKDSGGIYLDDFKWGINPPKVTNTSVDVLSHDEFTVIHDEDALVNYVDDDNGFILDKEDFKNSNDIRLDEIFSFTSVDGLDHIQNEQIIVEASQEETITLNDLLKDGTDLGDWSQVAGTITQGGQVYDVYRHSGVEGELLVQQGVKVELDNH